MRHLARLGPGVACAALATALSWGLGQPSDRAAPVVVNYWHAYSGPIAVAHDELLAEFHDRHPDIRIEATFGGSLWTMRDKLLAAVGVGAGPDVASIDQFWIAQLAAVGAAVPLAQSGLPLESFGAADGVPALLETGRYRGELWSAPFASSTVVLYANLSLLDQFGLGPDDIPRTWDQLFALAERIPRDLDGDGRQDLWLLDAPTTAQTGVVFNYVITLWQYGGDVLSSAGDEVAFDSPEAAAALALWQRLVREGVLELVRPQGVWESGRALFQLASSARIVGAYGLLPFPFAVAPLPHAHQRVNSVGGRNLVVLTEDPAVQEAAFTFVRYLLSVDVGRRWAEATGYLPLRIDSYASAEYQQALAHDPRLETALGELLYARARPNVPAYADVSRVLGEAVEHGLHTQEDPSVVLRTAAADANAFIERQNRRNP